MGSHCRPPAREDDRPAACSVALLESRSWMRTGRDYMAYLSAAERERHGALRGSRRQREWLAGRLAAKYLFLRRLESRGCNSGSQWRPILLQLSDNILDNFPVWMYQRIEVPGSAERRGGRPRLRWCGRAEPEALSLSHKDNDACACLSEGTAIGVDLECAAPRVEAFYRWNYTDAEKEWVSRGTSAEPLCRDWLFTLLWAFKEAALKAQAILQETPWSFAGIGVNGLPAPQDVLWAYRSNTWGDQFGLFRGLIEEESKATGVHFAYAGTNRLVLAVVKPAGR